MIISFAESIIGHDLDEITKSLECIDTQTAQNQFSELCEYGKELLMHNKQAKISAEARWLIGALMIYGNTFIEWVEMMYEEDEETKPN